MSTPITTQPPRRPRWRRIPPPVLLAVAAAVLVIAALAWQQHHHDADSEGRPASVTPTPAPSTAGDEPAGPDLGDGPAVEQLAPPTITATDPAAQEQARVVAQRFAVNFASPNGDRADWLARLAPDVSAELLRQYRLTDIRNVTQADVVGVAGPVRQEPGTSTFDVDYGDGSRIEVQLETGTEGWRVITVLPLTSDGAAGSPTDTAQQSAPAAPTTGRERP